MLKTTKPAVPFALLLLLGIVAISFSSIFIKWSAAPVSVIAMYRLFLTNLIMLPLLRKYRHELIQIQLRDGFKLIWSGFCLGLHFLFWMGSLRFTSVASSTAILTLEPILVMLGSFLMFRLRTNWITVISMMVAISGAALMGWGDFQFSGAALQGDLLSFLGAATVAVHMLLGKNLRNHISAYVYSFFVFFIAGAV